MVIMVKKAIIRPENIPPVVRMSTHAVLPISAFPESFKDAKEAFEKEFIEFMLKKNSWNISKTSEFIQIERSNLHKKIKQLEIVVPKE